MIKLYSDKDIKIIDDNIDNIIETARRKELEVLEPTLDEFKQVHNYILDYIKKNKRIIYGGWAWNALIKHKNPKDVFYHNDLIDRPDIEFYSFTPVVDLTNLCNELNKNGYKNIQGKEANHEETYTLFVNFIAYCDITYMPAIIFHKIPLYKIDNIMYTYPKFILIDVLRMYNDPLTSYWRIKKNISKSIKLIKHYPLEFKGIFTKYTLDNRTNVILDYIRKDIINGSTLLVHGYYAYNYYIYKSKDDKKEELYVPYYDVISIKLEEDAKIISQLLFKFDNTITVEEYQPFYQFTDHKITFIYNKMDQKVPMPVEYSSVDDTFYDEIEFKIKEIENAYESYSLRKASTLIMELAGLSNTYFDHSKPWALIKEKENSQALNNTMYLSLMAVKALAFTSFPIMPEAAQKIWNMLGLEQSLENISWKEVKELQLTPGSELKKPEPLFSRVDDEQIELEIAKLGATV